MAAFLPFFLCASIVLSPAGGQTGSAEGSSMREAIRTESVVEQIHGVSVADPYRWLEDDDSPDVRSWVAAQNGKTRAALDPIPGRAKIRERLETLVSIGSISTPAVRKERLFYSRREGRMNQPVLYVREGLRGSDRVLLDPNPLSADGTVALDWSYVSEDGRYLAYGVSQSGSEQSTLRVRDVGTGVDLPDQIPHTRACSVAWEPSSRGFYYTRYPAPGTVPEGQENYNRRVFHHTLGDDPAKDSLVFGEGREPDAWPNVDLSPDGRWLVVEESKGWSRTQVYLKDLKSEDGFKPVVEGEEALYGVAALNDRLIIHTNEGAPTYRVFTADPRRPGRANWIEVIPPSEEILQGLRIVGGRIVAEYLKDASSRLRIFSMDGRLEKEIDLPTLGSVSALGGEWDGKDIYFGFTSFTVPPSVYHHDIRSGTTALWEKVSAPIDPAAYEIRQVRYPSKDRTMISMFVILPKGVARDGGQRVLLTGYGGFNVSLTPTFDRDNFLWLERGGAVAIPNLRGGGEYGETWHRAGMLANKQNVFDDFIAAAEYLIREGFTRSDRLAIQGGSNGGLLVGAALTQRPDLFRAVVCAVPLLDMVRYHRFQIARLWIPEYGSAEDPDQFRWLYAYSPYHHVKDGTAYPAVLLTAAESDSRVDPMHARKMAAQLQAATTAGERPILLRLETKAGHGAGKPLSKQLDEQTDVWSFLFWQLGVPI